MATTFPVRNKAKTLNTNIVNFEFEEGIKQDVFLLEFDLLKRLGDS